MKKLKTIEMSRLSPEQFAEARKVPLIVVLDDVRSLHNVGSVLRSADAFRVEQVIMCGITATPPSAEIHKTALGAEDSVSWSYSPSALDAVDAIRSLGYLVCSVEQCHGSTMLQDFTVPQNIPGVAVILGNEVKGVHQEVIDRSDLCLEIPQYGTKHSLNVSVTAGIVIWEIARKFLKQL